MPFLKGLGVYGIEFWDLMVASDKLLVIELHRFVFCSSKRCVVVGAT